MSVSAGAKIILIRRSCSSHPRGKPKNDKVSRRLKGAVPVKAAMLNAPPQAAAYAPAGDGSVESTHIPQDVECEDVLTSPADMRLLRR